MSSDTAAPNPLIHEKSPYLLQHANNPVHWRPWGDEAFSLAEKEDKPVFLSIGYATCHWCHVMERESFEDSDVARVLNQGFVPIKVDREERPDIDGVYMTVCQMITGRGGWPLTIIMTPDKKPFFAATYLPRKGRFGQPGLLELLPEVTRVWKEERNKVTDSADQVSEHLQSARWDTGGEGLDRETLNACFQALQERFDSRYGGFGKAPKFPTPHNLLFLLRTWRRTGNRKALDMVQATLKAMRRGGVFDHLGFGFHRYSTDERWLVPHFEKMLYDQAGMILALTETYLATGDTAYARMVQETAAYVLNEMTADSGGFFSAEDADSEGEEGKFYVWTEGEIESVLAPEEAQLVKKVFNTSADGNYKDEASGQKTGASILHLSRPLEETARDLNMETEELENRLSQARDRLFAARAERVRPLLDDKILTDWNGLMIAALARAGRALERPDTVAAAEKAAGFVLHNLKTEEGRLLHRFRDGEAAISGMLEDYAFFTFGLIELYEATRKPAYLQQALELTRTCLARFWDHEHGGFFTTADDAEQLLVRQKEILDGAMPSGNSVAMVNLLKLSLLTGDAELEKTADQLARAFSGTVREIPAGCTFLLCGLDLALGPASEVVIVGRDGAPDTGKMLRALDTTYLPRTVHLLKTEATGEGLSSLSELARDLQMQDGRATAFVCRGQRCESPVTDAREMLRLMESEPAEERLR
jgi:hypothetical protein